MLQNQTLCPARETLLDEYWRSYREVARLYHRRRREGHPEAGVLGRMTRDTRDAIHYQRYGRFPTRGPMLVGDLMDLDRVAAWSGRVTPFMSDWDEEEERPGKWLDRIRPPSEQGLYMDLQDLFSRRESLCLFAFERGMSVRTIARTLGVAPSTVSMYLRRAREKMRRAVGVQLAWTLKSEEERQPEGVSSL